MKTSQRRTAALAVAFVLAALPSAWAEGVEPSQASVDPATGQSTRSMAEWGRLAARALLDRSSILVVGTTTAQRTETVQGHPHTLTTVSVTELLRGQAPPQLTVRVEGGVLPDGTWEDVEGFALPLGRTVFVPLYPADRAVGLTPTIDGTYRIDGRLLTLLFGTGPLQPPEPVEVDGDAIGLPPCGACTDPSVHIHAVADGLADLLVATNDTLYEVLSAATGPDVAACGIVESTVHDALVPDAAAVVDAGCEATGGSRSGEYTVTKAAMKYREMPTTYRVWNNTRDLVGEENGVTAGAASWVGGWFSTQYKGLAADAAPQDVQGVVWWAQHDTGSLANARRHAGGWEIVYGDKYCWTRGAKEKCFDVDSAARHEFGHVLGLGHSTRAENAMFAGLPTNTTKGLGPGDYAGLRYLYPYNDYRGVVVSPGPAERTIKVTRGRASEDVTVVIHNTGRTPWNAFRTVRHLTDKPLARCSNFDGSGEEVRIPLLGQDFVDWAYCNQPALRVSGPSYQQTVEAGEPGTVTFRFNAPFDRLGTFKESFVLDLAGPLHVLGTGHTFTVMVEDLLPGLGGATSAAGSLPTIETTTPQRQPALAERVPEVQPGA